MEKTGGTFLFPRDGPPKFPCRRRRVCRSPHQPSLKRADGQQRDKQQDAESGDDRQLLQFTGQRPTLLDHVERSYSTQSLCQPLERARDTSDTKVACRGEGGIECAAHVHPPGGSLLLFRRERARLPGALAPAAVADLWRHDLRGEHPATTYAFTAMLATVLAGIAVGSLLAAPFLKRRTPSLWGFGSLHALAGIAALGGAQLHGSQSPPGRGTVPLSPGSGSGGPGYRTTRTPTVRTLPRART